MCGIAGYCIIQTHQPDPAQLRRSLHAMGHRGPDDEGISLIDPDRNVHQDLLTENSDRRLAGYRRSGEARTIPHRIGIGHRRFSLVDTSPAGHQPFWCPEGRVCVAFNGEIYNYVELREELQHKGFTFHTASDTEVLAMAYLAWGVSCFERFNGFWALALYDQERRQMLLARDRIGKAPLYVTRDDDRLCWASEVKGLLALRGSSEYSVNEQAVVNFVKWHVRDLFHETFYDGITSFPNAAYAWVEADGSYEPVKYWDVPSRRLRAGDISPHEARATLRELLGDAVRLRMRADVPVSVQLSGGVDSSTLLALAANGGSRIHAYTVAFPGSEANEEPFARQVADHYRGLVDYSVIELPPDDILDHADSYIQLMGEPFHSPNQFTNHQVWSTMARQGFRANLYGAGGDEVFAGYSSDYFVPYLRHLLRQGRSARFLREFFLFSEHRPGQMGADYFHRASELVRPAAASLLPWAPRVYHHLVRGESQRGWDPFLTPSGVSAHPGPANDLHGRMNDNMSHWLMNYWLRIDNQNSMGVPLELRLPFLDYRVVEFGFTMPMEFLIRDGWMKWLLRCAMEDLLPRDVIWRKRKVGFPFPLKQWLGQFKGRILAMVHPLDSPFLDMKKLDSGYDAMREQDPTHLWCLISLAMWWKRCVQGDRLS